MIPKEIEAIKRLLEANISGWHLEVLSTNWLGYWIVQLDSKGQRHLALLIDFDNLTAICMGLRQCINAASPGWSGVDGGAKTMFVTCARKLKTSEGNDGAITVISQWESKPIVELRYYRGGTHTRDTVDQALYIEDAMRLSDMLADLYNSFPDKQNWAPRTIGAS